MNRRTALSVLPLTAAAFTLAARRSSADAKTPFGVEYLMKVRDLLERIRAESSDDMIEASHRIAETVKRGNRCYFEWDMGHGTEFDIWPNRPGMVSFMTYMVPPKLERGDLVLSDSWWDETQVKTFRDTGVFLIGGPRPWGGANIGSELIIDQYRVRNLRPYADLWIDNFATAYGPFMNLPGNSAPMAPVSGVVGMMTFWMMVSDAARILVEGGKTFEVLGDEPALSRAAAREGLSRPLGQEYFETAVAQQRVIEGAFDKVDGIARMAVHSVLTGGRVYVYSRHERNLCGEATVRRGGLALTNGVWGPPDKLVLMDDPLQEGLVDLTFKPTEKDTIIMGLSAPDNPDDLSILDRFKASGASIAAIGPSTRNGVVPSGRTVPKEVEIHVGDMTDSYGIFALPGIARKIAPTSGLILNQIFWATCCQIASQIIERTGNVPGVYLNGALKGGMERLDEVKRLLRERGY